MGFIVDQFLDEFVELYFERPRDIKKRIDNQKPEMSTDDYKKKLQKEREELRK